MNHTALIDRLENGAVILCGFIPGVTAEQAGWRPAPGKWSLLEVMAHLLDEEREDFRVRLEHLLRDPDLEWPPIDPAGWVSARGYAAWDLGDTLKNFLAEREKSVTWLRSLRAPDWDRVREHPVAGPLRAGDLLAAWVAHDILHARQLCALHFAWIEHLAAPHRTHYAGDW